MSSAKGRKCTACCFSSFSSINPAFKLFFPFLIRFYDCCYYCSYARKAADNGFSFLFPTPSPESPISRKTSTSYLAPPDCVISRTGRCLYHHRTNTPLWLHLLATNFIMNASSSPRSVLSHGSLDYTAMAPLLHHRPTGPSVNFATM